MKAKLHVGYASHSSSLRQAKRSKFGASLSLLPSFLANETSSPHELEILVKIPKYPNGKETGPSCANFVDNVQLSKCEASQGAGEMRVLNEEETVANLVANAASSRGNLVLVYRSKIAT